MDKSGGTKQDVVTTRFPNGLPAVSDASQEAWMEYAYQQQIKPTNAKGVEVTITVLDPNNNCYDVATTTSDDMGTFCCDFTPEVPGLYRVIATFGGSESYYGSSGETYLKVEEASAATPPPTEPPASVADTYLLPATAGIIVAIVAIGLVIILMLRKR
jgi:hypothetical protein